MFFTNKESDFCPILRLTQLTVYDLILLMKILIVKLSSIGDIVHALPAVAAIRRALPAAEISWAVERRSAEILRGSSLLKNLIEVDTRAVRREKNWLTKLWLLREQFADLKVDRFDLAIDFQGLFKSALICKFSGARRTVGFAKPGLREPASRFLLGETIDVPARVNIIEKNLILAEKAVPIRVSHDPADYEFPIATEPGHKHEAEQTIKEINGEFAILHPGAGWTTKMWSVERFGNLADRIWQQFGLKSIVTFGPGEENLAQAVVDQSRSAPILAANLSLKGFYELAKCAQVYVGGDTGPMHLAVAANTKIVGIFGPTEWRRNGSPRIADAAVERQDIGCRVDCHRRACSNWICLDIEVERVLNAIGARLAAAEPQRIREKFEIV